MKILVSITSGANNTERNILRSFHAGIEKYYLEKYQIDSYKSRKQKIGIDLRLSYDIEIEPCDIAIQFGSVKERAVEHHITKQSIRRLAKKIIYIETPILGRTINKNSNYAFYRIGVNGFLNNSGIFYDEDNLDLGRLEGLKKHLEIANFPGWKDHTKGNILLLLQLPGDASLRGQRMSEWLIDTVQTIRRITARTISIRFHPAMSDKGRNELIGEISPMLFENYKNIIWQDGISKTLKQDLAKAGICISYSSGSSVDAVLQGVPCITIDEGNLAYSISSHRIADITNPLLVSRSQIDSWLIRLANSQWSENEMSAGLVWNHIVSLVEKSFDENCNNLS